MGLSSTDMGLSSTRFSDAGGAVTDLFGGIGQILKGDTSAESLDLKAQGDLAEAQQYDLAGALAKQNAQYTQASTGIQQQQQVRNTTMQIGGQKAAMSGSGFAESGSGLDILRDSAQQGALAKEVIGQQGQITQAGYEEQATSYGIMANTARQTAAGEEQIAQESKDAGIFGGVGSFIGSALKGAAAIATLAA